MIAFGQDDEGVIAVKNSKIWSGALLCAAVLMFTGCAMDDTTTQIRKLLATDGGPDDVLPADAADAAVGNAGSSRRIGDYAGVSYFVTEYVAPETGFPGFCLVLVKPGIGVASGCGSDRNAAQMRVGGSGTGSARLVLADDVIPDGWTKIGDFLIVNPEPAGI
jgi:hypothetical protein